MPAIEQLADQPVPVYNPLPVAATPQPPAEVITNTSTVNGPSGQGSVDNGGIIDQIGAQASDDRLVKLNAWSNSTFGMPYYQPSLMGGFKSLTVAILGGFVGGYHGYHRSGGKTGPAVGYGLAGAVFPLITLGVAGVQGYAKRGGR